MKRYYLYVLLALVAAPAGAAPLKGDAYVWPPAEYSHEYKGNLTVWDLRSQELVKQFCPSIKRAPYLGCAMNSATECQIFLAPEKDMKEAGFDRDIVLFHEKAHCNGWPANHPGARTVREGVGELVAEAFRSMGEASSEGPLRPPGYMP